MRGSFAQPRASNFLYLVFAQLKNVRDSHLEAIEQGVEHEARPLLGPVGRLEDLHLGVLVVVANRLAVVGHHVQIGRFQIGWAARHAQLNEEVTVVARKQVVRIAALGLLELLRNACELEAVLCSIVAGGIEEGVLVRVRGHDRGAHILEIARVLEAIKHHPERIRHARALGPRGEHAPMILEDTPAPVDVPTFLLLLRGRLPRPATLLLALRFRLRTASFLRQAVVRFSFEPTTSLGVSVVLILIVCTTASHSCARGTASPPPGRPSRRRAVR
eukprot:scaffold81914_cov78-Phaeocystis_antarctica.AAC.1